MWSFEGMLPAPAGHARSRDTFLPSDRQDGKVFSRPGKYEVIMRILDHPPGSRLFHRLQKVDFLQNDSLYTKEVVHQGSRLISHVGERGKRDVLAIQ